jgi:predicted dehydrogenase
MTLVPGEAPAGAHRRAPPRSLPRIPLLEADPRPKRTVKVGIVGLGKMGVAHSAVLSMIPDVEIVGVADHHAPLGKSLRGMGVQAPFFRSAEKLLEATTPDAVWICTQQSAQWPIARSCLEAKAAVFVEKPLTHTLEDALELVALAEKKKRPVACGYTLAFLPVFAAAQHALSHGAVGEIKRGSSSMYLSQVFRPQRGWIVDPARSGGGVVANISSHLLFLLRWYLGMPAQARATWQKIYGEVEDEIHGAFVLGNGAEIGFESSWSVSGYPLSAVVIEVEGENGKLLVSNDALELDLEQPRGGWPAGHTWVRHTELPQPARFDVNGEGYYLEDAHFLTWVTGGPEPPNTVELALDVQRMMAGLYESARSGGASVAVPR